MWWAWLLGAVTGLLIGAPGGVAWGWIQGWNRGKLLGDRAHEACHEAQKIVLDEALAAKEHADMRAWEEEL